MRTTYERIKIIPIEEHLAVIRLHMGTWVHTEMIHNYVRGKDSLCVHRYTYVNPRTVFKEYISHVYNLYIHTYISIQYVRLITLPCICTYTSFTYKNTSIVYIIYMLCFTYINSRVVLLKCVCMHVLLSLPILSATVFQILVLLCIFFVF